MDPGLQLSALATQMSKSPYLSMATPSGRGRLLRARSLILCPRSDGASEQKNQEKMVWSCMLNQPKSTQHALVPQRQI